MTEIGFVQTSTLYTGKFPCSGKDKEKVKVNSTICTLNSSLKKKIVVMKCFKGKGICACGDKRRPGQEGVQ